MEGWRSAREGWRSDLFPRLEELRLETCCTDTRLVSGDGASFPLHSLVLAAASPLLRRLLAADTADVEGGHTLLLPDTREAEVEAMVEGIYTGQVVGAVGRLLEELGLLGTEPTGSRSGLFEMKLKEEDPWSEADDFEDMDYKETELKPSVKEERSDSDSEADKDDHSHSEYNSESEDPKPKAKIKKGRPKKSKKELKKEMHKDRERIYCIIKESITCMFCGEMKCNSVSGLRRHQKSCEANLLQEVQCHVCNKPLNNNANLKKHIEAEHQDRSKQEAKEEYASMSHCKFCNLQFQDGQQAEPHLNDCLRELLSSLRCCHCPVEAPTKAMLVEHMASNHGVRPPPYSCLVPHCDKISSSKTWLVRHLKRKHDITEARNDATSFCKLCPVPNFFQTEEKMRKHESAWHKEACKQEGCDFTCESEQRLQEHGNAVHGLKIKIVKTPKTNPEPRTFCEQCGKTFANASNLRDHMELHENKEIMCDKCDKVFKRKLNLQMHMKYAHNDQTFSCQYCIKVCKNRRLLNLHVATWHEERKYKCDVCPKGFVSKSNLEQHMVSVHTKGTPYSCKYGCGRAYNDPSNCRQHERSVHEGNPRGPKQDQAGLVLPAHAQ